MSDDLAERRSRATTARNQALADASAFLADIERQGRELDGWEKRCMGAALSAIASGMYVLAIVEVREAATPASERSPHAYGPDPDLDSVTGAQVRYALEFLARQPVREYPSFFKTN